MEEERRVRIRLYFASFPQWKPAVATIGLIVLLAAESVVGQLAGGGLMALVVGLSFRWFRERPTEEEMEAWLRADMEALEPRALSKGGLVKEELVQNQVVVIGPRFRNLAGAELGFRRGKDGRARFTPLNVTIINFTEHQLVAYQCAFDLTTGKSLNECVSEYFYNDIISVATQADTYTYCTSELDDRLLARLPQLKESEVNGKIQVSGGETFILSTSGGTSVRVELNDPVILRGLGGGDLPMEWAETAVQAVRKMLREKKSGALPSRSAAF